MTLDDACCGAAQGAASARDTVYVYCGAGAGPRSVASAVESLKQAFHEHAKVLSLATDELLRGQWADSAAALVMPGGADLPYCSALDGPGNEIVREYVSSGGTYIGLCAGAYYACSRVSFERGSPLEVVGPRQLAFFPGEARGGVFRGFAYGSEAGAVAAEIEWGENIDDVDAPSSTTLDYVNGGPAFFPCAAMPGAVPHRVLARYAGAPGRPAAAVSCAVGKGVAVLCGSHPELGTRWLGVEDVCGDGPKSAESFGADESAGRDAGISKLRAALEASQTSRWAFWLFLLSCARLRDCLR